MSTCNCKTEIEAKLLERVKASAPKASDHSASLAGYGLAIVGNKMLRLPRMEVRVSAMHPVKKGGARLKRSTMSMFFTYCPFCGVKVQP